MINALEDVVRSTVRALRDRDAAYCRCQQCEDDVLTYAMNNLRPRYVGGTPLGAAVTRVALEQDAAKAEVAVVVIDAMRKVARRPHHGSDTPPGRAEPAGTGGEPV
jgi:competence protein ComFB